MRLVRAVLLASGMLFVSTLASATGLNFSWDNCTSESGVQSKTFACNTNSGSRAAWASFVLGADQDNFVGLEAVHDIRTDSDSLASWWMFYNSGSCRSTALSASCDFSTAPSTNCTDFWQGQAQGGIAAYQTYWTDPRVPSGSPNAARIKLAEALPASAPVSLTAGTEYYAFKLVISNTKTVGTGACGGCSVPACISLYSITARELDGTTAVLTAPITASVVYWQGASSCPGADVPPPQAWGQIRSLLR